MGNPLHADLRVEPNTPEQITRARRAIALHAADAAEARTLLDMLGILNPEGEIRK